MPSLTVTGGVIFDADRALGVQGDGRTSDSSASIWEATTNLENSAGADVSFESGTTGYTTGGTNTIESSSEQFKFGAKACKATYQDDVTLLDIALALTAAAQSASRWLYIPAAYDGGGVSVQFANYAGATGTLAVAADMGLRDQWQRVEVPNVVVAGGDLVGNVQVVNTGAAPTAGRFVYIDGCQTETQPLCTPFTISPRAAARVQAAVDNTDGTPKFTETSGAVLVYARMGWPSTSLPNAAPMMFEWRNGTAPANQMSLFRASTIGWEADFRRNGTLTTREVATTHAKDDLVCGLIAWTDATVALGINGAARATTARGGTVGGSALPTTAEFGNRDTLTLEIDSDLKFAATFDSGDITDAEWAALYARVQQGDCAPEDLTALLANSACTAVMPFDTASYLDEAFTIIDPDSTGASRGILPHLRVDIDFDNDPTNATRVWTDVTPDVRQLTYTRSGRNHELQRTEAGSLSALLDNRTADYDPTNATGPHYPGVKRMRWMRVRARYGVTDYPRWKGLIEQWRQEWPSAGKDATVQITATDALKVLNLFDLDGLTYSSETTDVRVANVLTSVGIDDYTVDTAAATTVVAASAFAEGSSALAHLLAVEESENGLLFAEGDGKIVFQGRHYRLLNSNTSMGTIGDGAGEIPYRTAELDLDDGDLWNEVSVTPDGGAAQTVTDAASVASHYTRRLNRTILSASEAEALSAAQFLVARYADPSPRVPKVDLLGNAAPANWPTILGLGNSDRLAWIRRAAVTIEQDVFVEKVADRVVPGTAWDVSLQLSPALDQAGWVAGDPVYSLAGETTRANY